MLLTDAVLLQLVILVLVLLDVMAVAFEIVVIVNLVEFVDERVDVAVVAPESFAPSLDRAAASRAPPSGQPARVRRRVEERDVEAVLEELPRRAEPGPPASDDDSFRIRSSLPLRSDQKRGCGACGGCGATRG